MHFKTKLTSFVEMHGHTQISIYWGEKNQRTYLPMDFHKGFPVIPSFRMDFS
jgi:hypothetical protein